MPRDYSKPPRSSGGRPPSRGGPKSGGYGEKKPWERRGPSSEGGERRGGDRPYRKPFGAGGDGGRPPYRKPFAEGGGGDRPPYRRPFGDRPSGGGDRPYRKPFGPPRDFDGPKRDFGEKKDFRPPRYDEEMFTASGKVGEIVGTEPQSKFEIQRKLWDFFRAEDLIANADRKPRANADDWRNEGEERPRRAPRSYDDAPPKRAYRKPTGEHPTARKAKTLEGVPRRKYKETKDL